MAILNNKTIICNAGHYDGAQGFKFNGLIEGEETKKIRDLAVTYLKQAGYEVIAIPDNLNLRQSIDFANLYEAGLAVDIHLNSRGTRGNVSGTEVYTDNALQSQSIANILSKFIAKNLGTRNAGYKHHTQSGVGSLGWITQVKCPAFVIECAYMDEPIDATLYAQNGQMKITRGLVEGINYLYGVNDPENVVVSLQQQIINLSLKVVELINKLLNRNKYGRKN